MVIIKQLCSDLSLIGVKHIHTEKLWNSGYQNGEQQHEHWLSNCEKCKFLGPPLPTKYETLGVQPSKQSIISPSGDSDAYSSLRTSDGNHREYSFSLPLLLNLISGSFSHFKTLKYFESISRRIYILALKEGTHTFHTCASSRALLW